MITDRVPGTFLADHPSRRALNLTASGLTPVAAFDGRGNHPLEVALAKSALRPRADAMRRAWKVRHGGTPSPLLLVVAYEVGGGWKASICGPAGDEPPVEADLDLDLVERIAAAALGQPSRNHAIRFLGGILAEVESELPGIRNHGMLATQELRDGVPQRPDWAAACERSRPLLGSNGRELVERLGFHVEHHSIATTILSVGDARRAVAVFLDETEEFEAPAARFGDTSPVTHALAYADRAELPWVVVTRGTQIRLYSAGPDVGVGRKGRADTYVEANLALIPIDRAGYVTLLFSAEALRTDGTFTEILETSRDHAAALGLRLRDRVYEEAVPGLALALAKRHSGPLDEPALAAIYEQALTVLFRLLFVAYAEDKDLLPYRSNGAYRDHALKTRARELAERRMAGPLVFDGNATDLWDEITGLWTAVDRGNVERGVPPYNGGLFSIDPAVNPAGGALDDLTLTNAEFGPALVALLLDEGDDAVIGPVDFRSLSVREFGTIYEGLLESSLSVAPSDLSLDSRRSYVPVRDGHEVVVDAGAVYFHNRSGARKSSGSYFTKSFAVEHLLDHALEPALDEHLARVNELVQTGEDARAAEAFFDFRCVDLAMGSGHFLVAAVDRIEARLSGFLALHPIPQVTAELDRLRAAAYEALGPLGQGIEIEHASLLRRQVARRCIYGIDLNTVAVELARLGIWIHTFVPGLPLSFLDHSLVRGNSLTGIGTLEEAVRALDPGAHESGTISYLSEQLDEVLERADGALRRLARATDASAAEIADARAAHVESLGAVEPVRDLLDLVVAARLGRGTMPTALDEAHVAANPMLVGARELRIDLESLHFPVVFPEVFLRPRLGFDCVIGNPPWQEATVEELGFWSIRFPGLKAMPAGDQRATIVRLSVERPDLVSELQTELAEAALMRESLLVGPYPGMSTGDPDVYKAFAWRFLQLVAADGHIGVVLPHSIFATKGSGPWRRAIFERFDVSVTMCRNQSEWLFTDVNPGYSIDLVAAAGVQRAPRIEVSGTYHSLEELLADDRLPAAIDAALLKASDPDACLPALESREEFELFSHLIKYPSLGAPTREDFKVRAATDLHATNDRPYFWKGRHPLYNHLNINHLRFDPAAGEFASVSLAEVEEALTIRRVRASRDRRSVFSEMDVSWIGDPNTLSILNPRIAFRDVVHASNPRKVWAALVPPESPLTNTAPYLVFPKGDILQQAYLLGLLGSSPVDWFGHLRVVLHLNYFILYSIPIPKFENTEAQHRLAELAVFLAGVEASDDKWGDWITVLPRDRPDDETARAELDGIAASLYELSDEHIALVWRTGSGRPQADGVRNYRDKWQGRHAS